MLDFPRLLARGLLIHFPDPNAYGHRLAKQFGKHVIYPMISVLLFPIEGGIFGRHDCEILQQIESDSYVVIC
jgi:hypothetical protein